MVGARRGSVGAMTYRAFQIRSTKETEPSGPAEGGAGKAGSSMGTGNDSDRYVVPNDERGGWDVVKGDRERASAHTDRKTEAIDRAREIVGNLGGGEIRIQNKHGQFIDS